MLVTNYVSLSDKSKVSVTNMLPIFFNLTLIKPTYRRSSMESIQPSHVRAISKFVALDPILASYNVLFIIYEHKVLSKETENSLEAVVFEHVCV